MFGAMKVHIERVKRWITEHVHGQQLFVNQFTHSTEKNMLGLERKVISAITKSISKQKKTSQHQYPSMQIK